MLKATKEKAEEEIRKVAEKYYQQLLYISKVTENATAEDFLSYQGAVLKAEQRD